MKVILLADVKGTGKKGALGYVNRMVRCKIAKAGRNAAGAIVNTILYKE